MKPFVFVLFFFPVLCFAQLTEKQRAEIDSIQAVLKTTTFDSIKVKSLQSWGEIINISNPDLGGLLFHRVDSLSTLKLKQSLSKNDSLFYLKAKSFSLNKIGVNYYLKGNYDTAIHYFHLSLKIREKMGDREGSAGSLNNIGIIYFYRGDYKNAIYFFNKSLEIREELTNSEGLASSYNNIGMIYEVQGNYANAIDYYTKSLKIYEQIEEQQGLATALNNIGNIYYSQNENQKALDYFKRSLASYSKIGDQQGISVALTNIGNVYSNGNKYDEALEYYNRGLKLNEELKLKSGTAIALNNIGSIYYYKKDFQKAISYLKKALEIRKKIDDKSGISSTYKSLGSIFLEQGEIKKALDYNLKALSIAQSIGALELISASSKNLWKCYKELGQYKESLKAYELYVKSADSLTSEENQKEVIKQKYKYEYEKKAAADSVKAVEEQKVNAAMLSAEKAENKQKVQQTYFLYGGLALSIIFGIFIFNRFRITNKQKGVIELQKKQVDIAYGQLEQKNNEIIDSINYAKRIQMAILPPLPLVKECFDDFFIFYKPKDIVAGDFYWMEKKDKKTFIAVADCTGHGVPGALVSVICNNALNRSVREYGLINPAEILDKSREIVINEFEKSEDEVKDGMDIALCILEDNTLHYAGANNPLWIIRKEDNFISEIKANKQPIGKFYNPQPYTNHTIELNKGDSIYLFSDGYADQFGGLKDKKFKAKALRELLLHIKNLPMQQQGIKIEETFNAWKGSHKQLDDVCLIGIRV